METAFCTKKLCFVYFVTLMLRLSCAYLIGKKYT